MPFATTTHDIRSPGCTTLACDQAEQFFWISNLAWRSLTDPNHSNALLSMEHAVELTRKAATPTIRRMARNLARDLYHGYYKTLPTPALRELWISECHGYGLVNGWIHDVVPNDQDDVIAICIGCPQSVSPKQERGIAA